MINSMLIFIGAGFGGILRYWASLGTYWLLGRQFPYGTLLVNATGCFVMGVLYVLFLERLNGMGPYLRPLLLIGFLGGYTTFSSFSVETLTLFESGNLISAGLNILLNVVICILLTWLGMVWGRQL